MLPALLALTALAYLPGVPGPSLLDDQNNLGLLAAVEAGRLGGAEYVLSSGDGGIARPVARLSFLVNWWLAGDDLRAFKAVNLALHLIGGLLVFTFVRQLARADPQLAGRDTALALLVSATWLLAPLLVSTVLYTVQRMAQLSALLTLAGLCAYTAGRSRGRDWPIAAAFVLCWPLATLSKENGALLPLLALLVEIWFFAGAARHTGFRRLLLGLTAIPAALVLARIAWDPAWLMAGYQERDFTLGERLLTQPRVLLDYLGNLVLAPGASPLGLLRDDVVASTGLLEPVSTVAALLAWAALLALAFASRGTPLAGAGFGVLFFVAAHLLEAGVFPLELYFEHRNYLPAVGALFATGVCVISLARRRRALAAGIALALVLVMGLLTAQRAWLWRSDLSLYQHAVHTHPRSARAWLGLAGALLQSGRFESGRTALDRAQALLGPDARLAVALQELAAACVLERPPPDITWQRVAGAGRVGADLHTANALAWLGGAITSGECDVLDRQRLASILARLDVAPARGRAGRLRDSHLDKLRRALSAH
jgi:hypothetical protein